VGGGGGGGGQRKYPAKRKFRGGLRDFWLIKEPGPKEAEIKDRGAKLLKRRGFQKEKRDRSRSGAGSDRSQYRKDRACWKGKGVVKEESKLLQSQGAAGR